MNHQNYYVAEKILENKKKKTYLIEKAIILTDENNVDYVIGEPEKENNI